MFRPSSRFLPRCLLLGTLLGALLARPITAAVGRWSPLGPDGGTVQTLAADPNVPGTLWAGTDGSGIWKSTDGGVQWAPSSEGLTGLGAAEVFALAVAPDAPGTVWAATHGGIYKTADGGATWQRVWYEAERPDDTHTPWVVSVAADPGDPDGAWAGTARGWVLKTTDGGASWTRILDLIGEAAHLLIDPTQPATAYANGRAGLYKTTDGGATWTQLREGQVDALALDPIDPRVLYSSGHAEINLYGVWKSTDGGTTWSLLSTLDESFVKTLRVASSSVVLAGTSGDIWRSEDAGATWQRVRGLPYFLEISLEADPTQPGRIWLGGTERGVFRSLDSGRTWEVSRTGLSATHVKSVAFDPVRPRTLYTVAENLGVHRSTDAGRTWTRINARLPAGGGYGVIANTVAADPSRPGVLFAGTGGGIYRSLDRGARWATVGANHFPGDVNSVAFDPARPGTVFSGGDMLLRSRDGGSTWRRLALPATEYEPETAEVIVAPLRPRTVFVLDFNQRRGEARSLFRSLDEGNTWTQVFADGAAALALHPTDPEIAWLATEATRQVWRSNDGGKTWKKVATGVGGGVAELTTLLVDRLDPSILYVGTNGAGVWRSTDSGVTWAPLSAGMIAPRITCLEADPRNPRRLLACTWGGGLLEIRLSS